MNSGKDHDTLERIRHTLYVACRKQVGRASSPTAAVIDSQSVKGAEKVRRSIDQPGYEAGKNIRSKGRHFLFDAQGLLMQALVHPADLQDRDGGALVMATLFGL